MAPVGRGPALLWRGVCSHEEGGTLESARPEFQVLISFLTGFVSFNTLHTFSWYFMLSCLRSEVTRLLIKDGRLNISVNLIHLSRCHYRHGKVVFVYLLWHKLIKD